MPILTWDRIDITQESIEGGQASIYVNKELQRVQRESLQALDGKGVIKTFPARLASRHTSLVLKEPKTKTSVRRVFLPKTVAEMLQERYKEIAEMKELFGDEYTDYDLVFCSPMGTPIEGQDGQLAGSQAQDAGGDGEINQALLMKLLQKPELAAMLKTLAQAI